MYPGELFVVLKCTMYSSELFVVLKCTMYPGEVFGYQDDLFLCEKHC